MTKLFVLHEPSHGIFQLDRDLKKRLIKVMRLKVGDSLVVFSPGKKWECRLQQIQADGVQLEVIREQPVSASSGLHLILGQAIPKGDGFEWLIEKGTELGISEIFPLITERTIVKPTNIPAKVQRWNEISQHAAGQSENPFPALVHSPLNLLSFLKLPGDSGLKLLLHERTGSTSLRQALATYNGDRITFVVGPEGGWTAEETDKLLRAGFQVIHLGTRVLKSETSGLVLAALLQYERGDFHSPQSKRSKE
jgi:16S rRNA (uracil1498-N3)-methyltransferase